MLQVDLLINCIYLTGSAPPFLTPQMIDEAGPARRLKTVVDVSCDATDSHNPLPIYSTVTTFDQPTVAVDVGSDNNPPMRLISIDHLPSFIPREATTAFSQKLLPCLLKLPQCKVEPVWTRAKEVFDERLGEYRGQRSKP